MRKGFSICVLLVISFLPARFVSAAGEATLYGYISCSMCGAKGATESHQDCMEKCLAKGASVVIVTDNDHAVVTIENPNSVSGHHAHRVALYGYPKGDAFHVIS